jgi:predicted PurR-regulated permease PerM
VSSKTTTIWFLAVLILLVLGLTLLISWPFLQPVAFAIIVAVIFFPLYERVLRWVKNRRGFASLLTTLSIIFVFSVPVAFILLKASMEAITAAQNLAHRSAEQGGSTLFLASLLQQPMHFLGRFVDLSKFDLHAAVAKNLQKVSVVLLSSGAIFFGGFARFIVSFVVMLVVVFFLFRDGPDWARRFRAIIPLSPAQTERLFRNVTDTIVANVYGIVSVGFAQGLLTGIAVAILGLPSALLLGVGAALASVVPIGGPALVWAPAALYLIFTGSLWKGVILLAWGALVVNTVDNFIRPWVVSGKVELHPLVLLFFILGGVEAFGFLGLFLGPVVASALTVIFAILRDEITGDEITTLGEVEQPVSLQTIDG